MPGIGKSAKFRSAAFKLIFVLASSEELAAEEEGTGSSLEEALSDVDDVLLGVSAEICGVVIVRRERKKEEKEVVEVS